MGYPPERDIQHEINTGSATPVASRPYRFSYHERQELKKHLAELLEQGLVVSTPEIHHRKVSFTVSSDLLYQPHWGWEIDFVL
jgi:hypothetical protein